MQIVYLLVSSDCIRVGLEECSLIAESIEGLAREAGREKRAFSSPAMEVS